MKWIIKNKSSYDNTLVFSLAKDYVVDAERMGYGVFDSDEVLKDDEGNKYYLHIESIKNKSSVTVIVTDGEEK